MSKRVNVILPDTTLAVLDRMVPHGKRSSFISTAVLHYVRTRSKENLRERLKQEALTNSSRDLDMAKEWFPLEEEAWLRAEGKRKRK